MMFISKLIHSLTNNLEVDAPETTKLRCRIIREKRFVKQIYLEWYAFLIEALGNTINGPVLELGSGGGFLKNLVPGLITSEVLHVSHVDAVLDGQCLPFSTGKLKGILMTNVLHHLTQPRVFLAEFARCVQSGGVIAMIEPWVTPWSRFVYGRLHHEPFQPDIKKWEIAKRGPLSGGNGALPWILFERDRAIFEKEFPEWQIRKVHLMMPIRYLLSGGVSLRALMPYWTFRFWCCLEILLRPWMKNLAMFAGIVLKRTGSSSFEEI